MKRFYFIKISKSKKDFVKLSSTDLVGAWCEIAKIVDSMSDYVKDHYDSLWLAEAEENEHGVVEDTISYHVDFREGERFSDQLKYHLEKNGLSQAKAAELLFVPLRTFESWVQGKRKPPIYIRPLILKELLLQAKK